MTSLSIPSTCLSSNRIPRKAQRICVVTRATSFKTTSLKTLYDTLGIPIGATTHDIKSAYRKLARVCHPDVERNSDAGEEFKRIHAAYVTLSDPQKREDYDRKIIRRRRPLTSADVCGGGYSIGRNWETDQCW